MSKASNLKVDERYFINPFIHSCFGEMLGTCIYDGTWVGKDSSIPNINGIRKDVIEGLKDVGIPAIRWPGGGAADHYHWQDGVGPVRRRRLELYGQGNEFGTDEFIELCRLVNAEPILVANVATGTPSEFADWYEYCNGGTDTKFGALRAEYGHPEPYDVKYWGIGNTDDNVWHIAFNDPIEYARDFLKWRDALNKNQKNVKLIGLGLSERHELPGWVEKCLDYITGYQHGKAPDYLSVHHYTGGMKARYAASEKAVEYSDAAYYFALDSVKAFQKDIDLHRQYIKEHTNIASNTKICFDEWGLWHPEGNEETGINQPQTLRDGLFAALSLHLFYRNSDIVEFAMETQYSNVVQSLFETKGEKFYKTPTFYAMKLLNEHLGQYLIDTDIDPENKMTDVLMSADKDLTKVVVSIVNKSLDNSASVHLPECLRDYSVIDAKVITCDDVHTQNTFEKPELIRDVEFEDYTSDKINAPAHSVVRLVFATK